MGAAGPIALNLLQQQHPAPILCFSDVGPYVGQHVSVRKMGSVKTHRVPWQRDQPLPVHLTGAPANVLPPAVDSQPGPLLLRGIEQQILG